MKKLLAFLLLLALLLTGCAKEKDKTIVVNPNDHTISDGTHTYEYTDTTIDNVRTIIIKFPDGGTYTWTHDGTSSQGHTELGQGTNMVGNGPLFVQAILNPQQTQEKKQELPDLRWVLIIVGVLVAGYGLWHVLDPVKVWDLFMRRWYQEDPGEYARTRIISSGIRLTILGIFLILLALFV